MRVLGIDPGQTSSGTVVFDVELNKVVMSAQVDNQVLFPELSSRGLQGVSWHEVAIEDIEAMGFEVGKTTLDTLRWVGRFQAACWMLAIPVRLIGRGDEKIVVCGCKTFIDPATGKRQGIKDSHIRKALIDKFPATGGGKTPQVGTKQKPGPLYGVSGHSWSALSVAYTYLQTRR